MVNHGDGLSFAKIREIHLYSGVAHWRGIERLLAVFAERQHNALTICGNTFDLSLGNGGFQSWSGFEQKVRAFLIVVHGDDRGKVLNRHAGVAQDTVLVADNLVAALPKSDLANVL